jgi:polyisoprenoid-binding protein YceI
MLRITSLFFFFIGFTILSCKNDPSLKVSQSTLPAEENKSSQSGGKDEMVTYIVTSGTVLWSGKKTIGGSHEGTITVASGELLVNRGNLVSGKFVLDMHSLSVTSIKDGGEKRDLESHLKDIDFFEVNQFPKAEFQFSEALPSQTPDFNQVAVGELTIKGKSNSVNIPVALTISGNELTARSPTFSINRTKWGITFRSGMTGTVKDKLIEDTVLLTVRLSAKRQ